MAKVFYLGNGETAYAMVQVDANGNIIGGGSGPFVTKAGAFVAADVPNGSALDGYDSTNNTRKRYLNQGGVLYSIAYA